MFVQSLHSVRMEGYNVLHACQLMYLHTSVHLPMQISHVINVSINHSIKKNPIKSYCLTDKI